MNQRFLSILIIAIAIIGKVSAQSYNQELNYLNQYVHRMYVNAPFQGVRVVSDIDKCYLICIIEEQMVSDDYATQRKVELKAMRLVNEFLNGAQISSSTILQIEQTSDGYTREDIVDFIESRSMGYVQQMQVISTFVTERGKNVFVFCKELPMPKINIEKDEFKKSKNKRSVKRR